MVSIPAPQLRSLVTPGNSGSRESVLDTAHFAPRALRIWVTSPWLATADRVGCLAVRPDSSRLPKNPLAANLS